MEDFSRTLNKLDEPFDMDELTWKVQRSGRNSKGIWAVVVPYVKASAIETRLDTVVGKNNWKNEAFQPGANGGLQCGVSIRIKDEWVTKWDGADNTQFESIKGGMSDAFKRAARKWGIGRYLTSIKPTFAQVFDDPKQGTYRDSLKESGGAKTPFSWNPPGLPSLYFPQNLPKKEDHRSVHHQKNQPETLSQEEWQRRAQQFQKDAEHIRTANPEQDRPSEEETNLDGMRTRIADAIKTAKAKKIRLESGHSAYLHYTKRFFAVGKDWQDLHDLECELSNLLAEDKQIA